MLVMPLQTVAAPVRSIPTCNMKPKEHHEDTNSPKVFPTPFERICDPENYALSL